MKKKIARIALTDVGGAVEEFTIGDEFHFLLGYAKCGPDGGKNVRIEVCVFGSTVVLGQILYLIGETHPELLNIVAMNVMARPVGGVQWS